MHLSFEPFVSCVAPTFWATLSRRKLEDVGLDETAQAIYGHFLIGHPQFYLDESSFTGKADSTSDKRQLRGKLILLNTLDSFKQFDRNAFLQAEKQDLLKARNVEESTAFYVLAFADLKKYRYYYQVCFPALVSSASPIHVAIKETSVDSTHQEGLFAGRLIVYDSSSHELPVVGWNVRRWLFHYGSDVKDLVLSRKDRSLILTIESNPGKESPMEEINITGWEKNADGKIATRIVDLSTSMDPIKLAQESAGLNLKLIKWRLLPELDLNKLSARKCLLFGAGTLGCGVARSLLGWGITNITFVDNGKVSYSNPVRQSLFRHEDALNGGLPKAETAAQRALEIAPFANIKGLSISIPMPGHLIDSESELEKSCHAIVRLIVEHDVIFLLTDSRESRWLPSLLGSFYDKLVVTVALGFDSFVVMRHGNGNGLGCYFCNDVNGPTNTLSGRTLDQQCTVTRPGLSLMASSVAVELVASILQHPLGQRAPATQCAQPTEPIPSGSSMLGAVPHQIRGFLSHFQNLILTGDQFACCPACSSPVLEEFRTNGIEFVKKSLEQADYLEKVSGLALLKESEARKIATYQDDFVDGTDDF